MAMMLTTSLPKFKRLCLSLDLPTPHALGHLEMLWQHTHATGDPEYPADDIEVICEWRGEEGLLLAALLKFQWLDDLGGGLVEVHDYWTNAPEFVKDRERKREKRRTTPDKSKNVPDMSRNVPDNPGQSRNVGECPRRIEENRTEQKENGTEEKSNTPLPPNGGVPESDGDTQPTLPGVPDKKTRKRGPSPEAALKNELAEKAFFLLWHDYPPERRYGMLAAKRAFLEVAAGEDIEFMRESLRWQKKSRAWTREGGKYIPSIVNWIRDGHCHNPREEGGAKVSECIPDNYEDQAAEALGF